MTTARGRSKRLKKEDPTPAPDARATPSPDAGAGAGAVAVADQEVAADQARSTGGGEEIPLAVMTTRRGRKRSLDDAPGADERTDAETTAGAPTANSADTTKRTERADDADHATASDVAADHDDDDDDQADDAQLLNGKNAVTDPAQASRLIGAYMRAVNRPYNAADIGRNLHGRVGKTLLSRSLTSLVNVGVLSDRGGGKVFCIDQSDLAVPSPAEIAASDAKIESLRARKQELAEDCVKTRQRQLDGLLKTPTTAGCLASIDELSASARGIELEIASAKEAAKNLPETTAAEARVIDAKLKHVQAEEKRLKRLFTEISADFSCCLGLTARNMRPWLEEIGIDISEL